MWKRSSRRRGEADFLYLAARARVALALVPQSGHNSAHDTRSRGILRSLEPLGARGHRSVGRGARRGGLSGAVGLCGNVGLVGISGWFWARRIGRFRAYAADPRRVVLLRYRDGSQVVVTPHDVQHFIVRVKTRAKMSSEARAP